MSSSRKNCILQVEDEEADIFLLQTVFEKAGIVSPVRAVRSAHEAIEYLLGEGDFSDRSRSPLPSLMLLDLKLPGMSGFSLLEWVRKHEQWQHLVVVVFSSSAEPQDVRRAYELGANSYIQKPFSLEQTVEVAQLLKGWWLGYNRFPPLYERNDWGSAKPSTAGWQNSL